MASLEMMKRDSLHIMLRHPIETHAELSRELYFAFAFYHHVLS